MKIKAVLFDMDGVLFDSERYYLEESYKLLLSKGFKKGISALYEMVGMTMDGTYAYMQKLLADSYTINEIKNMHAEHFAKNKIDYDEYGFIEAKEEIKRLKEKGLLLALCSSSPKDVILRDLEAMGVLEYFDVIYSGEEFEESKPNPEIYLKAMESLNVSAENCAIIEDSDMGLKAAKSSKAKLVVAREDNRFSQSQDLADFKVKNLVEFVDYILN